MILEVVERGCITEACHGFNAIAEEDADECGHDDAEGEHPLKDAGSLAARGGGEALGEIERDDDADEAAAHALQESAEEERGVSLRESDDGDAEDECSAAENHERLAAHPVGEEAGEERGEDAAEQDGRDDDGELRRVELRGGFEIRQRAADDADIDAVEQAAEAGDEKQEEVVALASAIGGRGDGIWKSAVCHECALFYCLPQCRTDCKIQRDHQNCGSGKEQQRFFESLGIAAGDGADDPGADGQADPSTGDDKAERGSRHARKGCAGDGERGGKDRSHRHAGDENQHKCHPGLLVCSMR